MKELKTKKSAEGARVKEKSDALPRAAKHHSFSFRAALPRFSLFSVLSSGYTSPGRLWKALHNKPNEKF